MRRPNLLGLVTVLPLMVLMGCASEGDGATDCGDGKDNDGDGFVDCLDGGCATSSVCTPVIKPLPGGGGTNNGTVTGGTTTGTITGGSGSTPTGNTTAVLPDLVISSLLPYPNQTYAGGYVFIAYQVDNVGALYALDSTIEFRISADAIFDFGDTVICADAVPSLPTLGNYAGGVGCFVPYVAPGFYEIVARADSATTVFERNEVNNDANTPFTVSP